MKRVAIIAVALAVLVVSVVLTYAAESESFVRAAATKPSSCMIYDYAEADHKL